MVVTKENFGKGTGLKPGGKNEAVLKGRTKATKNGREVNDGDVLSARSKLAAEQEKQKAEQAKAAAAAEADKTSQLNASYNTPQQSSSKIMSTAQNTGGYTQVPGLQTQTVTPSARQEPAFTPKPDFDPVASSNRGVVYRTKEGVLLEEAATTNKGTLLSQREEPKVKTSNLLLPDKNLEGAATPNFYLDTDARRKVIQFGEYLESKGGTVVPETTKEAAKFLQGVTLRQPIASSEKGFIYNDAGAADKVLGGAVRKTGRFLQAGNVVLDSSPSTVGRNLQSFGYNPKEYVAGNVVLPAEGGALLGAGAQKVIKGTPAVAESLGFGAKAAARTGKVVEGTLVAGGVVGVSAEVAARGVDQRPDVVFGALGAVAGAKTPNVLTDKPYINTQVYGGSPTPRMNRATRLGLSTANKPTSKAEIRKQSFQQNYNPNEYRVNGEIGVKTGKNTREYLRLLEKGQIEVGQRRPATELGIKGQKYETGLQIDAKGSQPQPVSRYYMEKSGNDYGNLGASNANFKYIKKEGSNVQFKKTVDRGSVPAQDNIAGGLVALQKGRQQNYFELLKNFDKTTRQPTFKSQPFRESPTGDVFTVPQYELTPNAPSQYSGTALGKTVRGGAQPGRQGVYDRVRSKLLAQKEARRTDFQLVEYTAPTKDIVLNRELPTAAVALGNRPTPVSVRTAEFQPALAGAASELSVINNGVIDQKKIDIQVLAALPETKSKDKLELKPVVKILPAVTTASKNDLSSKTNVQFLPEQKIDLSPAQQQFRVQRTDLSQRQKAINVQKVSFDLGTVAPKEKTEEFIPRNPPPFDFVPGRPPRRPPVTVSTNTPPPPVVPIKFSLPSMNRPNVADFFVTVGSSGKKYYFELGRGSEELVRKAGALAKNTAAARVRVVPLSNRANKIDVGKLLGSDFKKNKQGDYIQATSKRISSAGEKQQIPGASKNTRLTRGTKYGKAFSLNTKGVPLRAARRFLR